MPEPITKLQLRCLQTMWATKMRRAGIAPSSDDARDLRHQYMREITAGRAQATNELTIEDARRVLTVLSRELRGLTIADGVAARAAGTHGRHGHDDGRHPVMAGHQQLALIAALQGRLGWDQARLDAFVARQLHGQTITTMADANRVIWPLKRMAKTVTQKAPKSAVTVSPSL